MQFQEKLDRLLAGRASASFLFVGSGFSRRYIGLEDWDGLLSKFCITGKPYNFYKSSANQDTPMAARLLSEDYYDAWWNDDHFSEARTLHAEKILDKTTPLRIAICDYLRSASDPQNIPANLVQEIEILKNCDVDGIITTNWDLLLENLFPEYRVFVGQKELLFSNPLSVAEIYKIHGCSARPESLILTDTDYADYNNRNAYLAAKLITIFVENPIVFIGYSLSDANIRSLIKSIASCIGEENINELKDNLIFVDRKEPQGGPTIETAYLQFDETQIPVRVIKTRDFSPVYESISKFQRKLPARVLRFCKERVFELVKNSTTDKKVAVVDFDSIDDPSSVEVIFGLGILDKFGEQGYTAITVEDLFEDLVMENKKYDSKKIINITYQNLPAQTKFVPIYKHLRAIGVTSVEGYKALGQNLDKFIRTDSSDFSQAAPGALLKYQGLTGEAFLNSASESEIVSLTPHLICLTHQELGNYLVENFEDIAASKYKYHFRRIMAYYDWLRYGF